MGLWGALRGSYKGWQAGCRGRVGGDRKKGLFPTGQIRTVCRMDASNWRSHPHKAGSKGRTGALQALGQDVRCALTVVDPDAVGVDENRKGAVSSGVRLVQEEVHVNMIC